MIIVLSSLAIHPGHDLQIEYEYSRYYPGTREDPPEEEECELTSVICIGCKQELIEELSETEVEVLAQEVCDKHFENDGEDDFDEY